MSSAFHALYRKKWRIELIAVFMVFLLCWQGAYPFSAHGMSIPDEIKLGRKILEDAHKHEVFIEDYLANRTVRDIGQRLMRHAGETPFTFQFFVLKDDTVNAFNVPGGLVFLTSGLLAFISNESELAGVMAHEISHGVSRHVAQMVDQQTKLGIVTLAAMIIGAVLARSAKGAQASAALPAAAAQSLALKYSREHEEEADAAGLKMMARAGFPPNAMVQLMKKFKRESPILPDVPSYFLTHPLEDIRMAQMEELMNGINAPFRQPGILKEYSKVRARMIVAEKGPEAAIRMFQSEMTSVPRNADAQFGLGVALREKGDFYAGAEALFGASKLDYGSAEILKELGRCYFEWGRLPEAVRTLQVALQLDDGDTDALFYMGRAHEELGSNADSLAAFRMLEERDPTYRGLYFHMGRIYDRLGKLCMAHYCLGQHFRHMGDAKMEKFHFDQMEQLQKRGSCASSDQTPPRPKDPKEAKEKRTE